MFKFSILLIIFLSFNLSYFAQTINKKESIIKKTSINWKLLPIKNDKEKLIWKIKEDQDVIKNIRNRRKRLFNIYDVKSTGRAVVVNNNYYPEISNYVPNAFVESIFSSFNLSLRAISKTRHCNGKNFSSLCSDGVFDFDINLLKREDFSFNTKLNLQSLSNRGTDFGDGLSIGFKAAKSFSPRWSLAIGGENIIHFDDTIDLGRNFYIVSSTYYPIHDNSFLFLNAGIGSDFYGYKGNGFLGETFCAGKNTLTGNGSNKCSWGPIASAAYALNDRFAIINEWFGYGYGLGFSLRPYKNKPLNFSIYATDYIKNFPEYIEDGCPNNQCQTRYYGSISYSF